MTESLTGNLLIASASVDDQVYGRGVCLMVHHDESGAIGVMLNRPMIPSAETLLDMLTGSDAGGRNRMPPLHEKPSAVASLGSVHFGGPLSGPVVAVHGLSDYAEAETGHGIYVAAGKQHLEDLVRQKPGPYRLIVGHLGWETDKLASELEAGVWHTIPATIEAVFANDNEMWPRLIRRATSRSMAKWIGTPDVANAGELN